MGNKFYKFLGIRNFIEFFGYLFCLVILLIIDNLLSKRFEIDDFK